MQGLLTLQNHCCNNWLFYFARPCDFTINFIPNATILADCCYIIIAALAAVTGSARLREI